MPYNVESHTAGISLEVKGENFEKLLAESVTALMKILGGKTATETVEREIWVRGRNRTELLINFLNEVLTLAQIEKESYITVKISTLTDKEVVAVLSGEKVEVFSEEVMAVTCRGADVLQGRNGIGVRLVFAV